MISADLYVLNGLMKKTTATTKFMRLTRTLGYAKVFAHRYLVNEEDVIELARAAAPIGWLADTGAWFCDHNDCWIVDFELGDRS